LAKGQNLASTTPYCLPWLGRRPFLFLRQLKWSNLVSDLPLTVSRETNLGFVGGVVLGCQGCLAKYRIQL
jgi:hypothetical protein